MFFERGNLMKIVQIGGSGHYYQVLDAIRADRDLLLAGFAPGSGDEDCTELAKALEREFGTEIYPDFLTMLDEEKPDIAVVNPYFYLNAAISKEVLARGINCYCEKPVALTLEELNDLENYYRKSGVHFAAMFEYRCSPAFAAAYAAVKEGKIGEPLLITAQKSYKLGTRPPFYTRRETYGGTIPWVGIHAIDWIRWMAGQEIIPDQSFHSRKYNSGLGELEVTAICTFRLANGGFATCNIDYFRPAGAPTHGDDRVRVVGTDGIVEVLRERATLIDKDGEHELPAERGKNLFQTFVDQVRGTAKCAVSAEDSFKSTEAALISRNIADKNM